MKMGIGEKLKTILGGTASEEDVKEVIFFDKDKMTGNEIYLQEINRIRNFCNEEEKKRIDRKIQLNIKKGIDGEKQTKRKLGYCDFYCNILSDVNLSDGDLKNQIDFLVITKKMCFIIECKNHTKSIKVLPDGRFSIGRYLYGEWKSEKIPSPIEQNNEHVQLVKNIYDQNIKLVSKKLKKAITDEYFKAMLVWVNNSSKINLQDAPEDIKNEVEDQFIYLERLVTYMNKIYNESSLPEKSIKEVEKISQIFYEIHKQNEEVYYDKSRQRALWEILRILPDMTPQELLRRELMYYKKENFLEQVSGNRRLKDEYKEKILNETMIEEIIEMMPENKWKLDKINNISSYTIDHFGEDIIEILNKYRELLK